MATRDSRSSPASRDDHEGVAVSLIAVSKTYRSGIGESVTAVDAVTLDIPPGQSLAITGRSGSGKSTLLHLIGAMDVPDEGQITIGGTDIARLRTRRGPRSGGASGSCSNASICFPPSPHWITSWPRSFRIEPTLTRWLARGSCSVQSASPTRETPTVSAVWRRAATCGDRPRAHQSSWHRIGGRADRQPRYPFRRRLSLYSTDCELNVASRCSSPPTMRASPRAATALSSLATAGS